MLVAGPTERSATPGMHTGGSLAKPEYTTTTYEVVYSTHPRMESWNCPTHTQVNQMKTLRATRVSWERSFFFSRTPC